MYITHDLNSCVTHGCIHVTHEYICMSHTNTHICTYDYISMSHMTACISYMARHACHTSLHMNWIVYMRWCAQCMRYGTQSTHDTSHGTCSVHWM